MIELRFKAENLHCFESSSHFQASQYSSKFVSITSKILTPVLFTDRQRHADNDLENAGSVAMFGPQSLTSERINFQNRMESKYDMLFKIVLTGDPNSGKSRILQRFIYGESSDQQPTVGVEFTSKVVQLSDNSVVNLQIWDTAGSERFRSVTSHYYRGAHGVIIVFDITNLDSFCNLPSWLEEVRAVTPAWCTIALMANKVDIMFEEPAKREVYREQAVLFCRDHGLVWVDECSALVGINIDETFFALAEQIY